MNYTLLEFDVLDSTNDFLKEHHPYFPQLTFVRANHQLKGRGQFDRVWESKANQNLLFSVLLKKIKTRHLEQMKQWVLEGIVDLFEKHHVHAMFKEPNDLYIDDQKVAGILIETATSFDTFDVVVIGVGININQTDFDLLNATSLAIKTKKNYDLNTLFLSLVEHLTQTIPKSLLQ
ncbi:MAG: biotin--[acetyl-CoA-carboxylase] ligase [Acholeplasmataceae bacterium]|jgi:biotin-[acetyl-CoA-carboxylase] ligase BirA-like protein|nr:biotin--[acetyl-CoA-carboxylase] ligase [Acholeplasmataceae bacterium]